MTDGDWCGSLSELHLVDNRAAEGKNEKPQQEACHLKRKWMVPQPESPPKLSLWLTWGGGRLSELSERLFIADRLNRVRGL